MINCMYVESLKVKKIWFKSNQFFTNFFFSLQKMQQNPNYAKLFRGRPLRFVLPLLVKEKIAKPNTIELLKRSISESLSLKSKLNRMTTKSSQSTQNCQSPKYDEVKTTETRPKNKDASIEALLTKNLITLSGTKCQAFQLNDGTIFCKPELLCNLGCETPRFNYERCLGLKYRYFYAISCDVDMENPGTIIKVDLFTRKCLTWGEVNCYPSEPIFVPTPDGTVRNLAYFFLF